MGIVECTFKLACLKVLYCPIIGSDLGSGFSAVHKVFCFVFFCSNCKFFDYRLPFASISLSLIFSFSLFLSISRWGFELHFNGLEKSQFCSWDLTFLEVVAQKEENTHTHKHTNSIVQSILRALVVFFLFLLLCPFVTQQLYGFSVHFHLFFVYLYIYGILVHKENTFSVCCTG